MNAQRPRRFSLRGFSLRPTRTLVRVAVAAVALTLLCG